MWEKKKMLDTYRGMDRAMSSEQKDGTSFNRNKGFQPTEGLIV